MVQESFANRWAQRERELGMEEIASRMIPFADICLPDSAAPCLSFDSAARPAGVCDVYGTAEAWLPADRERLAPYLVIGADGSGNPICLERATGTVLLLDQDDDFRSVQFINSNVAALAECLLAYMGEYSADRFASAVRAVDPPAFDKDSFWAVEATMIGDVA